jgi:hypothetical protein
VNKGIPIVTQIKEENEGEDEDYENLFTNSPVRNIHSANIKKHKKREEKAFEAHAQCMLMNSMSNKSLSDDQNVLEEQKEI